MVEYQSTNLPPTTSAYSLVTDFAVTMVSPLGASPHPPGPNALFSIRRYLISGRYTTPSGFTSMSSWAKGARRMSAASLGKGSAARPWNDRVQSTWRVPSSRMMGWSLRPAVRSVNSGWSSGVACNAKSISQGPLGFWAQLAN